jgi:hypothetical protein
MNAHHAIDLEAKARQDFNAFLNRAVAGGGMDIEHVRIGGRQPENEAFIRKTAAALTELSPATSVSISVTEVKSQVAGSIGLAQACAIQLAGSEGAPYLERRKSTTLNASLGAFTTLQSLASLELARRYVAAPAFASGGVSIALHATGLVNAIPAEVAKASDSVFVQSFADVYAISLLACVHGNGAALAILDQVDGARTATGDYAQFSLAPLSHDTKAALSVLRSALRAGVDFGAMGDEELFSSARITAAEGLAAWMQDNGVDYGTSTRLLQSFEQIAFVSEGAEKSADVKATSARP